MALIRNLRWTRWRWYCRQAQRLGLRLAAEQVGASSMRVRGERPGRTPRLTALVQGRRIMIDIDLDGTYSFVTEFLTRPNSQETADHLAEQPSIAALEDVFDSVTVRPNGYWRLEGPELRTTKRGRKDVYPPIAELDAILSAVRAAEDPGAERG